MKSHCRQPAEYFLAWETSAPISRAYARDGIKNFLFAVGFEFERLGNIQLLVPPAI
jgi:hypothetical protein